MRKIYYTIVVALQGISLLTTIVNIIFYAVSKSFVLFPLSIYSLIQPYIRFINNGNIFDLFALILFLLISVVFYLFSSKELLDTKNTKAPFIILNILWLVISYFPILKLNSDDFTVMTAIISHSSIAILYLPVIFIKWSQQNKVMRNKDVPDFEDPLPENFQLAPKSYQQIYRTAKGPIILELGVFLVTAYFKYMELHSTLLCVYSYLATMFFAIIIFFGTIHDCKSFKKKTEQDFPYANFLKKLNIMQIISFILFAVSFALVR